MLGISAHEFLSDTIYRSLKRRLSITSCLWQIRCSIILGNHLVHNLQMYTHQEWWLLWLLLTGLISVTGTYEADPLNSSTPHFWPMINVLAWHHLPLCVWGIILSLIFSWKIIKHFQSSSDRSHTIRGRQCIPTICLFMQIDRIMAWKEYLSARRQAGSQIWSDAGNNMVMENSHKPTGLQLIHFDSWWLPLLKYTSTHRKC